MVDPMAKKQTENELKLQIAALEKKIQELENNWKRALADYQNLEKRAGEERQEWAKMAAKDTLNQLLPVFDTFEQAAKHIKDDGLALAVKQLHDTLKNVGVQRIETQGKHFDPTMMEAIDVVESEKDGMVVAEVRTGFVLHGTLLRPAQVKVGKKKVEEALKN